MLRLAFVSTCPEPWGGSEELWSEAAARLKTRGHDVRIYKIHVDASHPKLRKLEELGCRVQDLQTLTPPLGVRIANRLVPRAWARDWHEVRQRLLEVELAAHRPHLVVISQGENFDALWVGDVCRWRGWPYVLISQKAGDGHWPDDELRPTMRGVFESARRAFFVARHNRELTEEQIGTRLPNADLVCNPFGAAARLPWPARNGDGLRLACVGRLWVRDKGQDLLLRVLAAEKWRARPLRVSFFGGGANEQGLLGLAELYALRNVAFHGFAADVGAIWREHHALVMASRSEGTPLVLLEAMMSGRPAIVPRVGGNADLVLDGVTGFLAASASVEDIDQALERAWQRRSELPQLGERAAERIRSSVPPDPGSALAEKLLAECPPAAVA